MRRAIVIAVTLVGVTSIALAGLLTIAWAVLITYEMEFKRHWVWDRKISQEWPRTVGERIEWLLVFGGGQIQFVRLHEIIGNPALYPEYNYILTRRGQMNARKDAGWLDGHVEFGYDNSQVLPWFTPRVDTTSRVLRVNFPVWLPVLLLNLPGLPLLFIGRKAWRRHRRRRAGRCLACGYDLRGQLSNAPLCPECGEVRAV